MILDSEPAMFYAGDSLEWTKSFVEYKASAGWNLHYSLKNEKTFIKFDAPAQGDDFLVSIAGTITADYVEGMYSLVGYVENGIDRHVVVTGRIEIRPDLTDDGPDDARSHNRKVLDAINSCIEGRGDVQGYTIGNRQINKMLIKDLLYYQQIYAHRVAKEEGRLPRFAGATFLP